MIKCLRLFLPLCASAVLLRGGDSIPALPRQLAVDPAQTKVEFTLGSLLHTVHGSFRLTRGTLSFDPQSGKASGELVVDAASGDSDSPARDKRMHAAILESGKYPEITFRPDRVEGTVGSEGRSQVVLHGMFAIHGVAHEMAVPTVVEASSGTYSIVANFEVPYVKWGMKNPSTLMLRVSDKVAITIHSVVRPM